MTTYSIEQITDQPEMLYVEIDRRFNLAIERRENELEIRVYPRTSGELWDAPYDTFTVDEDEIRTLEAELLETSKEGDAK